jgi:hypothetical protein
MMPPICVKSAAWVMMIYQMGNWKFSAFELGQ